MGSLDGSLKTKSQKPGEECVGCAAVASGGPSERVVFQSPSERNFFQKWSTSSGSASASRHPWEAIGLLLVTSVIVVQAAVIIRWRRGRSMQVEGVNGHSGEMHRLVQRDETVDEF